MSELKPVSFDYGTHQLRAVEIDGNPFFLVLDICHALDLVDTNKAIKRLDDDEKIKRTVFVSGQRREACLISESGFYRLVLTSRKPEAKRFQKWVTSEVLPEIRKTGKYQADRPAIAAATGGKAAILQGLVEVLANERKISTISAQRIKKAYSFILQNQH